MMPAGHVTGTTASGTDTNVDMNEGRETILDRDLLDDLFASTMPELDAPSCP